MSGIQRRQDEILAKRAKLEELKRTRALREKERAQRESGIQGSLEASNPGASTPNRSESKKELDELISSLVDRPASGRGSRAGSPAAKGSRPSSVVGSGLVTDASDTSPGLPGRGRSILTASTGTQTASSEDIPSITEVAAVPKVEVVCYNAGVQTTEEWPLPARRGSAGDISDSEREQPHSITQTPRVQKRLSRKLKEDELRENLRREIEEELKAIKDPETNSLAKPESQSRYPTRPLNNDELNTVLSSEDFRDFLDRSSRVIERALDQEYDVLADYATNGGAGTENDDEDFDEGYASSRGKGGRRLKELVQFYDERWCRKRMISDINFSSKFPELVLSSYTRNPSAPQDPSGLLHVWNLHLHSRPEYTFHASSDILTAKFSPFHPSLIIGGSYSGQVLLWDTRAKSPLPVQKTPLTGAILGGHTHPVYSIDLVGTQNANNIVSCSTDGLVCTWLINMLSQPQESLELTAPPPSKTEDLSPLCLAFPPSDPTSFLVGTEEGTIHPCHRYDRAGAKAGVDARTRYKGHSAPVTSLSFHPARGPVDLSHLAISSSLDWTVRLWKIQPPSSAASTKSSGQTTSSGLTGGLGRTTTSNVQEVWPVAEFPREDVVYDAKWSPQRPSVFGLVDGSGSVEIWDLLVDTEMPVTKATPQPNKVTTGIRTPRSLNKLAWEEKESKRLATGGAASLLTVFEVGGSLSGDGVRGEEWAGLKRLVGKMERGR